MNDKQLIAKLQELRQIKPSQNWVVSLKRDIVGESTTRSTIFEILPGLFSQKKLAFAAVAVFVVLVGLFGFAQNTAPGDFLFPIKKIAEQSQGALLTGVEQSKYNLEIANRRLEDLANIIESNKTNKIAPAVQEVKETINEIANNLPKNAANFREIAVGVKKIQETKRTVETLGVVMVEESDKLNDALAPLVENEIKVLDKLSKAETLTLEQEIRLVEVKSHYKKGEYTAALEKILLIINP